MLASQHRLLGRSCLADGRRELRAPRLAARAVASPGSAAAGDVAPLPVTAEGSGSETLFFVHGWPDDEHLWDAQVEHFRARFRCLRVTMPHFAGRARAQELGHQPGGVDFSEGGEIVAATIRAESPDRPVILVIHDWGCLWGFFAQVRHPELVKAVVAMDVGPPSTFPAGIESLPKVMVAGIAYQQWLLHAYGIAHATSGTPFQGLGRWVGDGMARGCARLFMPRAANSKDLHSDRITADACYPYYFFQMNIGVRGAHVPDDGEPEPSCPCLFFYGKRKPGSFHNRSWEKHLKSRDDCKVVPMEAGHWLQLEKPQEVNRIMEEWLSAILQRLAEGAGDTSSPRSRL